MLNSNTVNFKINIDATGATANIAAVGTAFNEITSEVNNFANGIKGKLDLININAFVDGIQKVGQAFSGLVGNSLDFESQYQNLNTLLRGDVEATDKLISQISEYGKATVYDRSGLIQAQKTMMSFGLEAEFAFEKLKNIGDIALGDTEKMKSLSLAFSQTTSTGKLMGQDLLQMINAGFNPLQTISDRTGESMASLKDKMKDGAISADMVSQAFQWATEEGALFYQEAEKAGETVAGKIAKIRDNIDEFKYSLFQATGGATAYIAEFATMTAGFSNIIPLIGLARKSFAFLNLTSIPKFIKNIVTARFTTDSFKRKLYVFQMQMQLLRRDFQRISKSILMYIKDTAKALFSTATFTSSASALWTGFANVVTKACRKIGSAIRKIPIVGWIAAIVSAVIIAIKYFESFGAAMDLILGGGIPILGIFMSIKRNWDSIVEGFQNGGIVEGFKRIAKAVVEAWSYAIKQSAQILVDMFPGLAKFFAKIYAGFMVVKHIISNIFKFLLPFFAAHFQAYKLIFGFIISTVKFVWNLIKGIFNAIKNEIVKVWEEFQIFWSMIGDIILTFWNWIVGIFEKIGINLREKLQPVLDFFSDLWDVVVEVFNKIMTFAGKIFNPLIELWNSITGGSVSVYSSAVATATEIFSNNTDKQNKGVLDKLKEAILGEETTNILADGTNNDNINNKISDPTNNIAKAAVGENRVKNINITIDKLVGIETLSTTNIAESHKKLEDTITDIIVRAINDVNLAV